MPINPAMCCAKVVYDIFNQGQEEVIKLKQESGYIHTRLKYSLDKVGEVLERFNVKAKLLYILLQRRTQFHSECCVPAMTKRIKSPLRLGQTVQVVGCDVWFDRSIT